MRQHGDAARPRNPDGSTVSAVEPSGLPGRRNSSVMVSPSAFVQIWWGVLGLHIFTATFSLFAAFIHLILTIEVFHRATSALLIPVALKRLTGLSYFLVTMLHVFAISRMIASSIRSRSLELRRPTVAEPLLEETPSSKPMRLHRRLTQMQAALFGPDGYVGINGPWFSTSLLLREAVEVMMQSYQLWTLSHNISRAWVNNLAMGAVVVNCFSIPIVNAFFTRGENIRRLMHLVVDMQLDFICSVLVPVVVIAPYPFQFDWKASVFPMKHMLDNVWFANAVSEARQTLVTSYPDYFSSLLPHYSIYNCLRILKRLIHRRKTPQRQRTIKPLATLLPEATQPKPTTSGSLAAVAKPESRCTRLTSAAIAVCGLVLLAFHIHAQYFGTLRDYQGCELHVKPWLVTKVACSVMVVNCYSWNVDGSASELTKILDPLEESVLTKVVFAHCPALVVPPLFTRFSRLGTLEIFNSTVVDWPLSTAVKQKTHPSLSDIYITGTNISTIPPAFLHSELPESLGKIAFYNCSVTTIPENIGDLWSSSQLTRVSFDYTGLQKIPQSFGRINLRKLWLVASPIDSIPDKIFANRQFTVIRLSGLPLQRLPDTVGDTSVLKELLVEHTNVSSLPEWATAWLDAHASVNDKRVRSFYGSPVCDPSRSNLTTVAVAAWRICDQDYKSHLGEFPRDIYEGRY